MVPQLFNFSFSHQHRKLGVYTALPVIGADRVHTSTKLLQSSRASVLKPRNRTRLFSWHQTPQTVFKPPGLTEPGRHIAKGLGLTVLNKAGVNVV